MSLDTLQNAYNCVRNEKASTTTKSIPAQKAYAAIIQATQNSSDDTKRRVATFLPLLFNRFPENHDQTLDALLDLCEDMSRETRLCAIAQLPNMVKEAAQYGLKISDVLFQLLQQSETQSEITVVKAALTTLLRFDTRAATVVLFQQLTRGAIPRKTSLEYFHQHVIPLRSPYLVTDPELERLVLSEIVKAFDIVTPTEAVALISVIPKLGIYENYDPLCQQEILNVFMRYVVVATKEFDPASEDHVKLLVDCIQKCLPLFAKKAPGNALLQFLATEVFPIERFQKISERQQLVILRGAAEAARNRPNGEILRGIVPLAKELLKNWVIIPELDASTTPSRKPTLKEAAVTAKITLSNIEPLIYLLSVAIANDTNLSFLDDTTYYFKLKVLYIYAQQEASQRKLEAGKIGEELYRQIIPLSNPGTDPISDMARSKLETFEKLILRSDNIYLCARQLLTIMKQQVANMNKLQENGGSFTPVSAEPLPDVRPSWWNVTQLSNVMSAMNSANIPVDTGNTTINSNLDNIAKKLPIGILRRGSIPTPEGKNISDSPPITNKRKADGGITVSRTTSSPAPPTGPTKRVRAEHPTFPNNSTLPPPGKSREVVSYTHNHTPYLQTAPIQAGAHMKIAQNFKTEHQSSAAVGAPRLHILNDTEYHFAGKADAVSPSSISFVGAAKTNPSSVPAVDNMASGISIAGAAGATISERVSSRRFPTRLSVSTSNPLETPTLPIQTPAIQATPRSLFPTRTPMSSDQSDAPLRTRRPSSASQSAELSSVLAPIPTSTISESSVSTPVVTSKPADDTGSTNSQKTVPEAPGGGKMKVESRGPPRKARAIYLPPAQRMLASALSSTEQVPDSKAALKLRTSVPVETTTTTTTISFTSPASSSPATSRFPLSPSSVYENSISGTREQPPIHLSSRPPSLFPVSQSTSNTGHTRNKVAAVAPDIQSRLGNMNGVVKGTRSIVGRLGGNKNPPAGPSERLLMGTSTMEMTVASGFSFVGASTKGASQKRPRKGSKDMNDGVQARLG